MTTGKKGEGDAGGEVFVLTSGGGILLNKTVILRQ
jgi:hypothetical protein